MQELYENTVRFEETDAQGIVFYGNYLTYQDEAFTEYLDAIGYRYEQLRKEGLDVRVVNVELDYHGSAQFRDTACHRTLYSRFTAVQPEVRKC